VSNKETIGRTLTVAFLLCIACSIVVSASVILLKPIQEKNKALNLKTNILAAAGLMVEGSNAEQIEAAFSSITPKVVDLNTGEYVDPQVVGKANALNYDQRRAAKDPKLSKVLDSAIDIASIKRRVNYAKVYLVEEAGRVKTIILPVSGYGLWSTLHGFLALESDANTVVGLGFYEHAETPGLGGEVDNPRWKANWPGKKVFNLEENNQPQLALVKGSVDKTRPEAIYQVDGLSGATLTSRGVTNLVQFWTGENGFQKYLNRLRKGA
jgi:Na+-transporting NADH:ubiquinone oxidoreductase subunit C